MSQNVATFFNQVVSEYDELIHAAIPRYSELLWAMFHYLPAGFQPARILELGCGTGNLTQLIAKRWPTSHITAVDISKNMLEETEKRLQHPQLTLVESSFEALSFPADSFDLVMASFSIHHLQDAHKKALIEQMTNWLTGGGFFVMADVLTPASEDLVQANLVELERVSRASGALDAHLEEWRVHRQTLDHYTDLYSMSTWLTQAGMQEPALLYAYLFNSVIQSQKPA